MYEVSPERGYDTRGGTSAAGPLERALEVADVAFGDDGAELGVHGSGLSLDDTVKLRMD